METENQPTEDGSADRMFAILDQAKRNVAELKAYKRLMRRGFVQDRNGDKQTFLFAREVDR